LRGKKKREAKSQESQEEEDDWDEDEENEEGEKKKDTKKEKTDGTKEEKKGETEEKVSDLQEEPKEPKEDKVLEKDKKEEKSGGEEGSSSEEEGSEEGSEEESGETSEEESGEEESGSEESEEKDKEESQDKQPEVAGEVKEDGAAQDGADQGPKEPLEGAPAGEQPPTEPEKEKRLLWERPWTIEELKQGAAEWTLAADAGLLYYLQEFSNNLVSKTKEVEKAVDDLFFETQACEISLHNTFNSFLQLAHHQFVENRVYDEDVSTTAEQKKEEQPQGDLSKEQVESILFPKYTEAMKFGLKALEMSAIKAEEDALRAKAEAEAQKDGAATTKPVEGENIVYNGDVPKTVGYKDEFAKRPLPYIIGTVEFQTDEYCGLFVEEDEDSLEEAISDLNDGLSDNASLDGWNSSDEEGGEKKKKEDEQKDKTDEKQGDLTDDVLEVKKEEIPRTKDDRPDLFGNYDDKQDEADLLLASDRKETKKEKKETPKAPEEDKQDAAAAPQTKSKKEESKKDEPDLFLDPDDPDGIFGSSTKKASNFEYLLVSILP